MLRRWGLLLIVASGSCAPLPQPAAPEPETHARYMVPLEAKETDWVCAETGPAYIYNNCISVKSFRLAVLPSVKAEP